MLLRIYESIDTSFMKIGSVVEVPRWNLKIHIYTAKIPIPFLLTSSETNNEKRSLDS